MKAMKFTAVFCSIVLGCLPVFAQTVEALKSAQTGTPTASPTQTASPTPVAATTTAQTEKNQFEDKYRIGYQDALEISVAKHPELSVTVNVGTDGTILMPRVERPVRAVCQTERELKENLETLYRSYLKNPYVNVRVIEQKSQPVSVQGAVEKPGAFNLNRKMRLLEVLALAGGPDVEFVGSKVQVARVGNTTACVEEPEDTEVADKVNFFMYELKDVQKGAVNPLVQPGDMVTVLVADEAYVVGEVKEPKKVSLREKVTLLQAIAAAGGIKGEAQISKIRIQRQEPNSPERIETVYDLKDIISNKIPDPVLQANDIVAVPKNGLKAARNGVLKAITGGLPTIIRGY